MNKKSLNAILISFFCAFLGALGQLFFKLGSATISLNAYSWIFNWQVILGVIFYAAATIIFVLMLKNAELSLLYPIIATSYIWVAFFSIILLGEKLFAHNWFGIFLIVGGVYLTSKK